MLGGQSVGQCQLCSDVTGQPASDTDNDIRRLREAAVQGCRVSDRPSAVVLFRAAVDRSPLRRPSSHVVMSTPRHRRFTVVTVIRIASILLHKMRRRCISYFDNPDEEHVTLKRSGKIDVVGKSLSASYAEFDFT